MHKEKYITITLILLILMSTTPILGYGISATFQTTSREVQNFSKYEGNLLIVDAVASWCTACEVQFQGLLDVYKSVNNTVKILTLSIDQSDTIPKIIELKKRVSSPPWTFALDYKSEFINIHKVSILPTLFLFDEKGSLIKKWESITSAAEILDAVNENIETSFDAKFDGENAYKGSLLDDLFGNITFQLFGLIIIIIFLYLILVPAKKEQNNDKLEGLKKSAPTKKDKILMESGTLQASVNKPQNKKKINKKTGGKSSKKVRRNKNRKY